MNVRNRVNVSAYPLPKTVDDSIHREIWFSFERTVFSTAPNLSIELSLSNMMYYANIIVARLR